MIAGVAAGLAGSRPCDGTETNTEPVRRLAAWASPRARPPAGPPSSPTARGLSLPAPGDGLMVWEEVVAVVAAVKADTAPEKRLPQRALPRHRCGRELDVLLRRPLSASRNCHLYRRSCHSVTICGTARPTTGCMVAPRSTADGDSATPGPLRGGWTGRSRGRRSVLPATASPVASPREPGRLGRPVPIRHALDRPGGCRCARR